MQGERARLDREAWQTTGRGFLATLVIVLLLFSSGEGPVAYRRCGDAWRKHEAWGAAERSYLLALERHPADRLALAALTEVYWQQGRFAAAETAARTWLSFDPAAVDAAFHLTQALVALNRQEEAEQVGREALARANDEQARPLLTLLADLALNRGDPVGAAPLLTQLLHLTPGDITVTLSLALVTALSDLDQAGQLLATLPTPGPADPWRASLAQARATPDPAHAATIVGRLALALQQPALAMAAFQQALTRSPAYTDALTGLALTQYLKGDFADAVVSANRALALLPNDPLSLSVRGLARRATGEIDLALNDLTAALAATPDDPTLVAEVAQTLLAGRRYAEAENWLQRAAELSPRQYTLSLARFYLERRIDVIRGGEIAGRAVTLAPDDGEAHDLLGWAWHLQGHNLAAQSSLQTAIRLRPDLATAYYHLGVVEMALGHTTAAQWALIRAIDRDREGGTVIGRARTTLEQLKP